MTAFRIIRAYTPAAFRFVMAALIVSCIYRTAQILAEAASVEIPQ